MLKRLLTFGIIGFLFISNLFGQEKNYSASDLFKVEIGEEYKRNNTYSSQRKFVKGNNLLIINLFTSEISIDKFDLANKKLVKTTIVKDYLNYSEYFSFVQFNEELYFSIYVEENDRFKYYLEKVDFETGNFSGTKILLTEIPKNEMGTYFGTKIPDYSYLISSDGSKFSLVLKNQSQLTDDTKNYEKNTFVTFDKNLNKIWENTVDYLHTEARQKNINFKLTDEGEIILFSELIKPNSSDRYINGKQNFDFVLFKINDSGISETKITANFQLKDSKMEIEKGVLMNLNKNEYTYIGFYGQQAFLNNIDGFYFLKFNAEGDILAQTLNEIPNESYKEYKSEKTISKLNEKEKNGENLTIPGFRISNGYFTSDNGIVLTCFDEYENLISSIKFNNIGNMLWVRKLPIPNDILKAYKTTFFYHKDDIYLFYYDTKANLDAFKDKKKSTKMIINQEEICLFAYKFSKKNDDVENILVTELYKNFDLKYIYQQSYPMFMIQTENDELFIECHPKNKSNGSLLKVTLND